MCEYCEESKIIMTKDVISDFNWGWGKDKNGDEIKISEQEADHYPLGVMIDRGYLRLVDIQDCMCIEGGEKIKISFCLMCGKKISEK